MRRAPNVCAHEKASEKTLRESARETIIWQNTRAPRFFERCVINAIGGGGGQGVRVHRWGREEGSYYTRSVANVCCYDVGHFQ